MIEIDLSKRLRSPSGYMSLNLDFKLPEESLLTIYGKSGAGKTSILRMIAGLLLPEKGKIVVNGNTWLDSDQGINVKTQKRGVGFLFQDYALFPNMTVKENLLFALDKGGSHAVVNQLIELIELGDLQNLKPNQLSGGQQQRVALARALVQKPELLMLDEPLSALDNEMRVKLQDHILDVHREYKLTTLMVSHDISEVGKMSDAVLVLDEGQVSAYGTPAEIFENEGPIVNRQIDGLTIRTAIREDFPSIYDFINELEEEIFDRERQWDIFIEHIQSPRSIYLVAVKSDQTIGFISCHIQPLLHHGGLIAEIQEMFVREEHRSSGVGKIMLDELKVTIKKMGVVQLEVVSNVKRDRTHKFYQNLGFDYTSKKFVVKLD